MPKAVGWVQGAGRRPGYRVDVTKRRAPPVWGDEERLQQVLTNLLSNAMKFTPSGGRCRGAQPRTIALPMAAARYPIGDGSARSRQHLAAACRTPGWACRAEQPARSGIASTRPNSTNSRRYRRHRPGPDHRQEYRNCTAGRCGPAAPAPTGAAPSSFACRRRAEGRARPADEPAAEFYAPPAGGRRAP